MNMDPRTVNNDEYERDEDVLNLESKECSIEKQNYNNDIVQKDELIKLALAKLTEEEKKILGLIPKVKQNYKLKIYYMIGDVKGNTTTNATISVNNIFLPIVTNALDKLKIPKGYWGLSLSKEHYTKNYNKKNINKLEYNLLCLLSGCYKEEYYKKFLKKHKFDISDVNINFLYEFEDLPDGGNIFVDDTEYSFLIYKGYKVK